MEEQAKITVNCNKEDDKESSSLSLNTRSYFEHRYETKLEGRGFLHTNQLNHEYLQYCYAQHTIVVYLQSETGSVRQIGDTKRTGNINYGDVAIIPAYTNHWQKAEFQTSEVIIITIAPEILSHLARVKTKVRRVEVLPHFARPNLLIQSIALNLKAEFDSGNCALSYIESLYNALMMHLLNNHAEKRYYQEQNSAGLPAYKLKQALDYINNNIDKSIKIQDIAKVIGISQYYFCRLFRESMEITPYRYVIQQRIAKAKLLIEEDKMSLLDIALECGFSSQSQMTHHFQKLVGTTPKVYRNRHNSYG